MKIRQLQRSDYNQVIDLMREFSHEAGLDLALHEEDPRHAHQVLLRCEYSGASLVAEHEEKIVGIILAMRVSDIWFPKIIRLREVAWYIKQEFRQSTLGGRLWLKYCNCAEQLQKQNAITGYTISRLATSPDFDYEARGFRFIESTYLKGH